jgi:hypothetical protein
MNIRWFGPKIEHYQRCISFIKINGSHSGENLATIINTTLIKYSIRQKLLSITADNAYNNTLCHHLLQMLSKHFDDHLAEFPIRSSTMRFKGEDSQVHCLAHILNLIVKAILESLGSSTHKDAQDYLDRASEHITKKRWKTIYIPSIAGVVAQLRLIVLWIDRSTLQV